MNGCCSLSFNFWPDGGNRLNEVHIINVFFFWQEKNVSNGMFHCYSIWSNRTGAFEVLFRRARQVHLKQVICC